MAPYAVSKAIPRQYQADDEDHLQSRETERTVVATQYQNFPNTKSTHETQLQLTFFEYSILLQLD